VLGQAAHICGYLGAKLVINRRRFIIRTILSAALVIARSNVVLAQTQESAVNGQSGAENQPGVEVSKQVANPLSNLWLMQFQQNNNWIGMPSNTGDRAQSNLQFQPLLPMKLTDNWTFIARPVLQLYNSTPFLDQTGQEKRETGFGDTVLAFALSPGPALVGHWLLAAGPTFILPTATRSLLGQDKWQFGPTVAVGYLGKHFIAYVFPQQWFSIGGNGQKTNQMSTYYSFVYFFSNGWSVGTEPNMLVNWQAPAGNKVTFPVGLQVGKLRKLGRMPVKFDVQVQYYPVHPQVIGPKWNIQLQVTPIIPSLIRGKIF
jgi:hypothetical protein